MAEILTSQNFHKKVIEAEGPVLVDFFATWCGPCKMLAPTIDQLTTELEGKASVYKVDIDQSPDLAAMFSVTGVPTLIVFENGAEKDYAVGAQPKQAILNLLGL